MSAVRLAIRVLCLLVVLSAIELQGCQARGGGGRGGGGGGRSGGSRGGGSRGGRGGRGGSKSSSSRLSPSFRSSSTQRGTSPYTRSNWKHYAGLGMIYGSSRYMRSGAYRDHPDEMPTVCTNQYDRSPNGKVWGYFICPREGEDKDMTYCCGEDKKEFCCRNNKLSTGALVGIILGPLLGAGLLVGLVLLIIWRCGTDEDKTNTGTASRSVHYQAKEPLPRSDFSISLVSFPYVPPQDPPPAFQHSDPPVSPSYPPSPPDGPPSGPTGANPSDPPPPFASLTVGQKQGEKQGESQSSPPQGFPQ